MKIEQPIEKKVTFPTPEEIQTALDKVNELLEIKQLNMRKNFHIKEGLTDCVRILSDRLENPENKWFKADTESKIQLANEIYRQQLKGIGKLKTTEGRTMAVMCVDFLNGQNGMYIFDNFKSMIKYR